MRWIGNVILWETGEVYTGFWWGDLREGNHLGDQGVDGIIVLKCVFKKWDGEAWTGLIGLRIGQVTGACDCDNEPFGVMKYGEFLD